MFAEQYNISVWGEVWTSFLAVHHKRVPETQDPQLRHESSTLAPFTWLMIPSMLCAHVKIKLRILDYSGLLVVIYCFPDLLALNFCLSKLGDISVFP